MLNSAMKKLTLIHCPSCAVCLFGANVAIFANEECCIYLETVGTPWKIPETKFGDNNP